ncbi:MAG: response regulator [Microcoleus sp. PH2017_29_MFU_D_A]|jgi:two-component system, chemotaxis family, response regulator Rcp1|uniref:response regulator n=1 Tax=unclassified Microcoleus TaxID=2642155 RepID=UPI001D230A4F|nr:MULTISPECIES: response regulator [unclassified Microcoleus]MCC3418700.1 response regulator [Microcoleus sp. PH2017_07_MST_O_A]MCC3430101.1 response regulator [Microcoleus sp. PH2017_04_SCI_O_A]MCC3440582.1 response regulator [Microcoleus sp. PH2017_03_ELD_O_A]MCC3466679.1 response regulator [Microcoleus sp. PH2017_06_SFM_O_A]MCC3502617.1 response regulator [Microcoleus sp. PH2017_19_SFW_U_A]MCC3509303.1 response regulator [Microcoleus sp. PH2017_17_BER_D_A]TAE42889.1 MAG: response regulat
MSDRSTVRPVEILLIEDSPSDADLAIEAFGQGKILNNLHFVEDGVEAIKFLHKTAPYLGVPRPDLILLDLNLPKKSGVEVLEEIKTDPNLKLIPVVILTTSAAPEDIAKSYSLHANCYITKPVDFVQFTKVVRLIEEFWLAVVKLPLN